MTILQQRVWVVFTSLALSLGAARGAIPCTTNVCGRNTQCNEVSGRPVCSCLPGHYGNPIIGCTRGECLDNNDCPYNKQCRNAQCENVCAGMCGRGANCDVQNHIPVCSCPEGYTGDPFNYCRLMDPNELCNPSPCGPNTNCDVVRNVPTCSCLPGFKGSAIRGCVPECESDSECRQDQSCQNYRCRSVCTQDACGKGARCQPKDHRAICSCPEGYIGNPYGNCRPECYTHSECPTSKPTCFYGKCMDPCKGACGQNANCRVRGEVAVCSCPRNMTGNPFQYCRPFTKQDLCDPNPCGGNAICQPGYDNTGNDRPVCTCPAGYVGDALYYCRKGECQLDDECRGDQICDQRTYECVNLCDRQCGVGAKCTARNHRVFCACPPGYTGDATVQCNVIPYSLSSRRSFSRYYYDN
ncbi:adhesive plaque matrix protein 2 [Anabrus simplex]|uniref:adhesive plaque matrix protein 2 n=1 Tax=Anabrus simplex TaxID=316456 RepID=UPI0035A3843E